jgi:hypothetical protein
MKTQSIMKSVSNINISVSASAHQRKKRGWRSNGVAMTAMAA